MVVFRGRHIVAAGYVRVAVTAALAGDNVRCPVGVGVLVRRQGDQQATDLANCFPELLEMNIMDVPTIEMDREQAKEKLKAYRRELHHGADEIFKAAARGYEALAKALKLIDIGQAITQGGSFPDQFPRLAVARADRQVVKCELRLEIHGPATPECRTQFLPTAARSQKTQP